MNKSQSGFTLLMSMLIVGFIALATTVALLLTGIDFGSSSLDYHDSLRAQSLANGCAEIALERLRDDSGYAGTESIDYGNDGSCSILAIQGSGTTNRTLQTTGVFAGKVSKVEVVIESLTPTVSLTSWQEVSDF